MSEKRGYEVIVGSKPFFDNAIKEIESDLEVEGNEFTVDNFLELVKISDDAKKNGNNQSFNKAEVMILKNDNYHGIVESAHDRLGALIEDLTLDNAKIVVHNPPIVLVAYLESLFNRELIELSYRQEKYDIDRKSEKFSSNINSIAKKIIGQGEAIREISKSLWYLTTIRREKPYVIMLHGDSSLGKSELVREIAKHFFESKFLEKHLSMFKNNNYADYFFGDKPNRKSIGYDLMERTSNLVFLDEFDKCPEYFYSAFYTLFDNTSFSDSTYKVDISGLILILTSNYKNEKEMKEHLGLPIYYRIDKFIHFSEFEVDTIYKITIGEIENHIKECGEKLDKDAIFKRVSQEINSKNENARTIKCKVQKIIEEMLFEEVI